MKVPKGMDEQQVLAVMDNVANRLANKFKFGYNDRDDMKQEARIICIEALESYDEKRPLENYLYRCVHNGLFNLKRNKYSRHEKPCLDCPFYDPDNLVSDNQCNAFSDKMECKPYAAWFNRNATKQNLMNPIEFGQVDDETEKNMRVHDSVFKELCNNELLDIVDKYLPSEFREDFVKLQHDIKIPKPRRVKLEQAVLEILKEHVEYE